MTAQEDGFSGQSDPNALLEANAALKAHNAFLSKELESLKQQLLSLQAELACGGAGTRTDGGRAAEAPSASPSAQDAAPPCSTPSGPPHPPPHPATASCIPSITTSSSPEALSSATAPPERPPPRAPPRHGLSRAQAERYSRHLLLPAFGVAAQERLCRGGVLVVGCGGLGSPAAMYLAAAGVGRIGLVDHDTVDVSNLHRQIMHGTGRMGMHKALSGAATCTALNPTVQVEPHTSGLTPANALALVSSYDVVIDASDNPATRYLLSDAAVAAGRPLVSAAAVGTDGQLTVYNYGEDGPCYRCLFPECPAPENCSRCGEAGVLGVVPGVMGCLQALEAIKVLAGVGSVSSKRLTIFDALAGRFTTVRLRGRSPACLACGPAPTITAASLPSYDYVAFTGQPAGDGPPQDLELLDPRVRIAPRQLAELIVRQQVLGRDEQQEPRRDELHGQEGAQGEGRSAEGVEEAQGAAAGAARRTVLLDVRPKAQYDVMALPGAVHVPFEEAVGGRLGEVLALCGGPLGGQGAGAGQGAAGAGEGGAAAGAEVGPTEPGPPPPRLVVLCRRGNNSQRVVAALAAAGGTGVTDLAGGYQAWVREVDPAMPLL